MLMSPYYTSRSTLSGVMAMATTDWKLAKGKTWRQKLEEDHPNHGKIVPIPRKFEKRFGHGTMLIPSPRAVDAILRKVRKGKVLTQSALRERLAADGGADSACPMTTGIFVRIVAEAAEEDARAGKKRITPYWRLVRDDGKLIEKFPGGPRAQARRLREEGLTISPAKGKQPPRVADVEAHAVKV